MSLTKKFDPIFSNKIAELFHCGFVEIQKWELLTWFQKERITVVVWNEIHDRWVDICEENQCDPEENKLLYRETGNSYMIINSASFQKLFNES